MIGFLKNFFKKQEPIQYHDVETVKGMIAVKDDGTSATPYQDISLRTSRFYVGRKDGDHMWEKHGWLWQEVEIKFRRIDAKAHNERTQEE